MFEYHVEFHGDDSKYHIVVGIARVDIYSTPDYRDARLFIAQLIIWYEKNIRPLDLYFFNLTLNKE